jgi:hypothetical protein
VVTAGAFIASGVTMDPETRTHLAQLIGPEALAAADTFMADLPPALVDRCERLLWTVDEGSAAHSRAEQRRVDTLIHGHLASGSWYDVLLDHCGGDGRTCCEHVGQPEQRMFTEAPS